MPRRTRRGRPATHQSAEMIYELQSYYYPCGPRAAKWVLALPKECFSRVRRFSITSYKMDVVLACGGHDQQGALVLGAHDGARQMGRYPSLHQYADYRQSERENHGK